MYFKFGDKVCSAQSSLENVAPTALLYHCGPKYTDSLYSVLIHKLTIFRDI